MTVKTLPQHDPAARHQVLMVLDEFPLLGAMPTLTSAFAFVAATACACCSCSRARRRCGRLRPGRGGDRARQLRAEVVFGTKDLALTKELSERLGYDTVESLTRSGPRLRRLVEARPAER